MRYASSSLSILNRYFFDDVLMTTSPEVRVLCPGGPAVMRRELHPQGHPVPGLGGVGQLVDVVIAEPELGAQIPKAVFVVLRLFYPNYVLF